MARPKKQPAPPKRSVGRPRHVPTPEMRDQVMQLLAVGTALDDIALCLGITKPTLVKRYDRECRIGRVTRRLEVVGLLFASARNGNVSAQKHLEALTAVAAAEDAVKGGLDVDAKPARRLGKKEQAAIEAEQAGAGTDWAGDLGPVPETAH